MPVALHKKTVTYSSRPTHAARAAHAKGDREFRTYDTSAIMPKRDPKPAIFLGVVALVIIAAVCFFAFRACATPAPELLAPGETVNVTIAEGESATAIGDALVQAGLIASAQDFTNEVTRLEAAAALIPGTYTFEGGSTPEQLVRLIMAGPASTGDTLTVPEDITRAALADLVAQATGGRVSADDFLAASADASVYAADYAFLETAGTNSLEGFLFPKTYSLTAEDDAAAIVRMMLGQFAAETANLSYEYPEGQGLNLYQTVTLASIVAKESSDDPAVRAEVAGVFYNRLASERPYLESDATTAYAVGHDPSAEEVHADDPYSTYTNEGLPPTPICSPGLASLEAVCAPAETSAMFFFFTSGEDGAVQHFFSDTYEEHQQVIADHTGNGSGNGDEGDGSSEEA
ncbi:endolytic transglycosylase MltG [uncultured Adlercreutzia sp.]|uniref:endolytic transglycosylase MltG n=1 Tax=uncultured Adlercreutzia sp. TaxID=875803 RepID=UPI00267745A9|nr:endolytic transglycosylase MltG [uncultured Adlercreutzia sp.]